MLVVLTNTVLITVALLLLMPIAILFIECLLALLPNPDRSMVAIARPSVAVLVPAHNESAGIRPVLEALQPQLEPSDQLVVIADNCTDSTAAVARTTGATVIERQDPEHRGKGFALDYGVRFLAANPPQVVIIIDADCQVQAGTLDRIARQAMVTGRPTQALYLMERPARPQPKDAVSALAFLVKNLVRPRGLHRLGLPCPLAGTGMAFPWEVIRQASLASGNIVEDMQLGIELAIAGYPPVFCTQTKVIGMLPQQEQAAKSQRTRWEHGHLQTIQTQVPKLINAAIQQQRFDLLSMALDLAVPPLSLLVMGWMALSALTLGVGWLGMSWIPASLLALEGLLLLLAIGLAWVRFGRTELPAQTLLAVPLYVLWKIPLYLAFLIRPQTKWIRTERDTVDAPKA